ncbi:ABC transporter permease subunit [bacterium]|nr:ABC transporter permease subunit [bacterium]
MLFALVMGSLALTETNKVVIDFFLMMVETVALFFVLFFGSHVLADERQQKTMYLLLSKKYDTAYILLGKFMAYFVLVVVIYLSFL